MTPPKPAAPAGGRSRSGGDPPAKGGRPSGGDPPAKGGPRSGAAPRIGRRPGPSSTREDILRAARRRFADQGYDRATFRSIAADAGVDPALVVQFFGSKQDLFVAAVLPPVTLAELSEVSREGDPAGAGLRLARLLMAWLDDEDAREAMVARIRSAATEPIAAEMVRGMIGGQLTDLARRLGGDRPDVRAALLASQFLGVVWMRYVVVLEPFASMASDDLASWLGRTFQLCLEEPLQPGLAATRAGSGAG